MESLNVKLKEAILDLNGGINMIKDFNWLQNKLKAGSESNETTFLILDTIDCKNILRNIDNRYETMPKPEIEGVEHER